MTRAWRFIFLAAFLYAAFLSILIAWVIPALYEVSL